MCECVCKRERERESCVCERMIERETDAKLQIGFFCDSKNKFQSEGWKKFPLCQNIKTKIIRGSSNFCALHLAFFP